jgi:xanthine dehydrogenase small subunit
VEQGAAIRFWHRGHVVEVDDVPVLCTVLDWLRRDPHSIGTKEGCNEGDCGACTVVLGEVVGAPGDESLDLRTASACLTPLAMVHGKALFTIEDLTTVAGGSLHPVQQAMVDAHGLQCGFCTPGMVMSLWALYERGQVAESRPGRQEIADQLAGNLCRCTGYRPILDAGETMFALPLVALDREPVITALREAASSGAFRYASAGQEFLAPTSVEQLAELAIRLPDAPVIAGGTDLILSLARRSTEVPSLIWTGRVAGMSAIEETGGVLRIGAAAPLEAAWIALVERAPSLTQAWLRFASPAIRNTGTMGGNLATGSPIGDSAPVLLALDATVELRRGDECRTVRLDDFYTGYRTSRLRPGEFLTAIDVPLESFGREIRAYKSSARFDSDISTVSAAFALTVVDGSVTLARIALGGMAETVCRARHSEAAIVGRPWTQATLAEAEAALSADVTPLSDHRGSADHRMRVARGLLRRFWLQTRPDSPLTAEQTEIRTRP